MKSKMIILLGSLGFALLPCGCGGIAERSIDGDGAQETGDAAPIASAEAQRFCNVVYDRILSCEDPRESPDEFLETCIANELLNECESKLYRDPSRLVRARRTCFETGDCGTAYSTCWDDAVASFPPSPKDEELRIVCEATCAACNFSLDFECSMSGLRNDVVDALETCFDEPCEYVVGCMMNRAEQLTGCRFE